MVIRFFETAESYGEMQKMLDERRLVTRSPAVACAIELLNPADFSDGS
jgi:hypothetical protein